MQGPLSTDRAPHSDVAMGNITDGDFTVTIYVTNHSLWKHSQYYRMVFISTTETGMGFPCGNVKMTVSICVLLMKCRRAYLK